MDHLAFRYIPHESIRLLPSEERIAKLLSLVKEGRVVLLEGRLRSHEEAGLIRKTMEQIDEHFKGIELAVINPSPGKQPFFARTSALFTTMLLGNRLGLTVIGPASLIREIRQDPERIELYLHLQGDAHRRDR